MAPSERSINAPRHASARLLLPVTKGLVSELRTEDYKSLSHMEGIAGLA